MEIYMKILRLFPILIAIVLVLSLSGPAPVEAKGLENGYTVSIDLAKTKVGSLVVDNRTGGTLYVALSGNVNYNFAATNQGKTTFPNITPGKYQITVRASACGGSLTINKKIQGKTTLKPFVCR